MVRDLTSKFRKRSEPTPPRGEASRGLLRAWGLDQLLTEEDDPELWAAVLFRYWPAPTDPNLDVPGLRFGLGDASYGSGLSAARAAQEGRISEPDIWCFEMDGGGGPQPVRSEERRAVSDCRRSLLIERPSKGLDSVLVDHYHSEGPLAGKGGTVLWQYSYRHGMWEPETVRTVRMS